jgi:hypothetical protein
MSYGADAIRLVATQDGVEVSIKVVPGASRNAIVGVLGNELKIAVCAPPEGGKANAAVQQTLADAMGIKSSAVSITHGASQPRKRAQLAGVTPEEARKRLWMLLAKR